MDRQRLVSIDATTLYKGQVISADLVWEHFVNRRATTYNSWLIEYGDEATAKAARLALVLQRVMQWLERDRSQAGLTPLVMNTIGGRINVLTDDQASAFLNHQAFSGLRRHQRATRRLIQEVDESGLSSSAARREHENRVNVHSFIAASTQGAQRQLKLLKRAGKRAPELGGR